MHCMLVKIVGLHMALREPDSSNSIGRSNLIGLLIEVSSPSLHAQSIQQHNYSATLALKVSITFQEPEKQ